MTFKRKRRSVRGKRAATDCNKFPAKCKLFGILKEQNKDVKRMVSYVGRPNSRSSINDLKFLDHLETAVDLVPDGAKKNFVAQMDDLGFGEDILGLAANDLIPGMNIKNTGVVDLRLGRDSFVEQIKTFRDLVVNTPNSAHEWFDEMTTHKSLNRYLSELNVRLSDKNYMTLFANEMVTSMETASINNLAGAFFKGSSSTFIKSVVGAQVYNKLSPLIARVKSNKGLMRSVETHVKKFGDKPIQEMFSFIKISDTTKVVNRVIKVLSVVDLIVEGIQATKQITAARHLANRVLPYVTELSKILESFDKLMIKILEDRNRSLRNAERYKFAVTLTPTQNAKAKQFPMPAKQRFTAVYDLLSELVDFSSMKNSLLASAGDNSAKLEKIPDPMCDDLSDSELRMVETAENNNDLRLVKEAADYEASLFLAQEEEADMLALSNGGSRKKREVGNSRFELGFMTKKLIEASDDVVDALKKSAEELGVDLSQYNL